MAEEHSEAGNIVTITAERTHSNMDRGSATIYLTRPLKFRRRNKLPVKAQNRERPFQMSSLKVLLDDVFSTSSGFGLNSPMRICNTNRSIICSSSGATGLAIVRQRHPPRSYQGSNRQDIGQRAYSGSYKGYSCRSKPPASGRGVKG